MIEKIKNNMELLFDLMNGTQPSGNQGTMREANYAYSYGSGSWKDGFEKIPSATTPRTRLCPSVAETEIIPDVGDPFEEGSGAGASGTGYVQFDSHMATNLVGMGLLLTYTTSGTVTISNVHWSNVSGYEDNRIEFDYCGLSGFSVNMSVDGFYNRDTSGKLPLDGGDSSEHGVAPCYDDYTFSLSY